MEIEDSGCHIFSPWPLLHLYFYAMGQEDGERGGGGNEAKAPHPVHSCIQLLLISKHEQ